MSETPILLAGPEQTEAFGARLANCCQAGTLIFLHGHLGAGKTTLVRGFLRGLGYDGTVKSPTYTLLEPYLVAGHAVAHLDLYRLSDPEELEWMGMRDLLDGSQTCLVEWPEQGAGWLPAADFDIQLDACPGGRSLSLGASGPRGSSLLDCLRPFVRNSARVQSSN